MYYVRLRCVLKTCFHLPCLHWRYGLWCEISVVRADRGQDQKPPVTDAKVVWTEHAVSMEERRAELAKYAIASK